MCLYPKLIQNPKYKANKKNGGNIPPVTDERVNMIPIGCGNCIECKKQKAREWQIRLLEDVKKHTNGKFITLTFNNESIQKLTRIIKRDQYAEGYQLDNEIATKAVRYFLERWRKKYKKSLRHWLVTELGHQGTEHIHIHGIIWTNEKLEEVERIWQYGWVWKGNKKIDSFGQEYIENYVNARTVNYIIKYVSKQDIIHKEYKSIILTSPGIGDRYTKIQIGDWKKNLYNGKDTKETYTTSTGHKIAMPTYYRNKIYTEEEREKLWLQKLNKQERWVLGTKIDIKNGEQEYNTALKWAQKLNKELGYGNNEKNWDQKEYEHQRRILKQRERLVPLRRKGYG